MNRVLKSVLFALIIIVAQIIIYKIYFGDAPPEIPKARLHKDFPAIPEEIDKELAREIERLNSTSDSERLSGAREIRRFKDKAKDAVPFLLKTANDQNEDVRGAVLDALMDIRDPKAKDIFLAALKDSNADNRKKAAVFLGDNGDADSVKPLIDALSDPEWDVKYEASLALKKLTGKEFGVDMEKWLSWYNKK